MPTVTSPVVPCGTLQCHLAPAINCTDQGNGTYLIEWQGSGPTVVSIDVDGAKTVFTSAGSGSHVVSGTMITATASGFGCESLAYTPPSCTNATGCPTGTLNDLLIRHDQFAYADTPDGGTVATVELTNITGWPADDPLVSGYVVQSFDGNLGLAGINLTDTQLQVSLEPQEICVLRTAIIECIPVDPTCPERTFDLEICCGSERLECLLIDDTVACSEQPVTDILRNDMGQICDDANCAFGQYSANDDEFDPLLNTYLAEWFAEVNTGFPIEFEGTGIPGHWARVTDIPSGRIEEHLAVVDTPQGVQVQMVVSIIGSDGAVVEQLRATQDTTLDGNPIVCNETVRLCLQSVSDPSLVDSSTCDISVSIEW